MYNCRRNLHISASALKSNEIPFREENSNIYFQVENQLNRRQNIRA